MNKTRNPACSRKQSQLANKKNNSQPKAKDSKRALHFWFIMKFVKFINLKLINKNSFESGNESQPKWFN